MDVRRIMTHLLVVGGISSVHEIASTGLTLSKLTVAASLLGDLVKQ